MATGMAIRPRCAPRCLRCSSRIGSIGDQTGQIRGSGTGEDIHRIGIGRIELTPFSIQPLSIISLALAKTARISSLVQARSWANWPHLVRPRPSAMPAMTLMKSVPSLLPKVTQEAWVLALIAAHWRRTLPGLRRLGRV